MKKVAFICVHHSCRSQIAEALGKKLASDMFESYSAGTERKPCINQDAVRLMKQVHGIDMEATQSSKLLSEIPEAKADEAFLETIRLINAKKYRKKLFTVFLGICFFYLPNTVS